MDEFKLKKETILLFLCDSSLIVCNLKTWFCLLIFCCDIQFNLWTKSCTFCITNSWQMLSKWLNYFLSSQKCFWKSFLRFIVLSNFNNSDNIFPKQNEWNGEKYIIFLQMNFNLYWLFLSHVIDGNYNINASVFTVCFLYLFVENAKHLMHFMLKRKKKHNQKMISEWMKSKEEHFTWNMLITRVKSAISSNWNI